MISPVYWSVLSATLILGNIAETEATRVKRPDGTIWKRPNPSPAKFLTIVLVVVAGLRYFVGTDYLAYYTWPPLSWPGVLRAFLQLREGGFALLVKLSRSFGDEGQYVILSSALITVVLYCRTIYKYSDSYMFSMLLYLLMGEWQGSFNAIRQYIGAAIIFSGHRFILERNFRKYCIVVFLAMMFHKTSVVMILPYFLLTKKPSHGQLALLAIGAVILRFSYGFLFDVVSEIKGQEMDMYADEYYTHNVNILRILVSFIPVFIYLLQCKKTDHTQEQDFYVNIIFFNSFCMLATMGSAYLARIGSYTNAAVTIAYGSLFQMVQNDNNSRTTKYLITAMYFFYWLYSLRILNDGLFRFNLKIF